MKNIFHKSKSQSEMIGLLIIVALISFGLIFYLVFVVLVPPKAPGEDLRISQLALSTTKAILDTTTDCRGLEIETLLTDCAMYHDTTPDLYCSVDGVPIQLSSCEFLANDPNKADSIQGYEGLILYLLNETLGPQVDYNFQTRIESGGTTETVIQLKNYEHDCLFDRDYTVQSLYLPSEAGGITVSLGICH